MKIDIDSPWTTGFLVLCFGATLAASLVPGLMGLFVVGPGMGTGIVLHLFGHGSWAHFAGNATFLLLCGPTIERQHGGFGLVLLALATALATWGACFLTGDRVVGASGFVFACIAASTASAGRKGEGIPLTLLLATLAYGGREIMASLTPDHVSQMAHLVGGFVGAVAGMVFRSGPRASEVV